MPHGSDGSDIVAPRSRLHVGRYGRLFPDLPPWSPPGIADGDIDAELERIAVDLMVEAPDASPGQLANQTDIDALEAEFGSNIPAGYTYFGQFVDHDITFETTSNLQRKNDPNALHNFRTPRFDLDNVYGRGPADQPYLYTDDPHDRARFITDPIPGSDARDLQRNSLGRALIGDMRNDENSMVSQLQLAFLSAHNTLVGRAAEAGMEHPFDAAQTTLRRLYQWVVWNDFIKRITVDEVQDQALRLVDLGDGRRGWELGFDDIYSWKNQPFIPIEFSVAAYRFGHSMVRNSYQTNAVHRGPGAFAPIFDNSGGGDPDDLRGFRPLSANNAIQWDWFLPMTTSSFPFPQMARKIDTKMANALAFLHEKKDEPSHRENKLAFLNLKRGMSMDLPSGTDVARQLGVAPIELAPGEPDSLWYYILKEAESLPGDNAGEMLGRVGSLIVCSVFAGLLVGDPTSWVNVDPEWTPDQEPLLQDSDKVDDDAWRLASIIRLADASSSSQPPIDPPFDVIDALLRLVAATPIRFDRNRSSVRAASKPVLDDVAQILLNNPDFKVEVGGHTDSVGTKAANRKLSKQRADAVRKHLIDLGVSSGQLKAKGYGESELLIRPETNNAARQANRRIGFKALP